MTEETNAKAQLDIQGGIHPVFNRLLVKQVHIKLDNITTRSGIMLAANSVIDSSAKQGEIVAVGETADSAFSVGQKILWGKYGGVEVSINDQKYTCINDDDVMAILDEYSKEI
ncbi:MAG: co-chaperone GroES [Proteobacteria bacterium]|nr:co-chaperone GroES [Pseudomonadota bacterium]